MVRRVMVALLLVGNLVLPLSALAGTAYLPLYIINGSSDGDGLVTSVQVSNLSNFSQNVSLTLYNPDGRLLAGQRVTLRNGTPTLPDTATDANGQITAVVAPFATVQILLRSNLVNGVDDIANIQGFGRITSTPVDPANGSGFVVANGYIRDTDLFNTANIYHRPITINGGSPF